MFILSGATIEHVFQKNRIMEDIKKAQKNLIIMISIRNSSKFMGWCEHRKDKAVVQQGPTFIINCILSRHLEQLKALTFFEEFQVYSIQVSCMNE